jgi:predicted CopG family antitoxin
MSKTITIDDEAYKILKSHKFAKESFSEVVKKHMAMARWGKDLDAYLAEHIGPKRKKKK